jgi:hypothetical protein
LKRILGGISGLYEKQADWGCEGINMKCSYHPAVESQEICTACNKPLCSDCAHKIKGKAYCQDCLIEGAEWASTIKGLRLPSDAPKRAAFCAIIPGLGAVYNTEYLKAVTYFAVWAALAVMGNRVNGVFGFGSFVFILFTMFDAYRSAESRVRRRVQTGDFANEALQQDKTLVGWGVFLIILGVIFLLHNLIPFYFLNRFWPLIFILLGAFLVYRALQSRKSWSGDRSSPPPPPPFIKEDV